MLGSHLFVFQRRILRLGVLCPGPLPGGSHLASLPGCWGPLPWPWGCWPFLFLHGSEGSLLSPPAPLDEFIAKCFLTYLAPYSITEDHYSKLNVLLLLSVLAKIKIKCGSCCDQFKSDFFPITLWGVEMHTLKEVGPRRNLKLHLFWVSKKYNTFVVMFCFCIMQVSWLFCSERMTLSLKSAWVSCGFKMTYP